MVNNILSILSEETLRVSLLRSTSMPSQLNKCQLKKRESRWFKMVFLYELYDVCKNHFLFKLPLPLPLPKPLPFQTDFN